jgi:hypothetical protein
MNAKAEYKVEEYNRNIPLLFSENPQGRVHSKFNNGFNVQMNDSLVFVGGDKGGQLPFGLILPLEAVHQLLGEIKMNDKVSWNHRSQILQIDESCDILFLEGKPYDNKLEIANGSAQSLQNGLETLLLVLAGNNEPTGMNLDIHDFMENYVSNDSEKNNYEKYYELIDALYSDDEAEIESILRYFLGRGKGGTPTGDDYIIGLMAIYAISEEWSPSFPEVLSTLISKEKITTDVSLEYLKYALKNQFGSPVIELIHALLSENDEAIQEKVNNLLSMGHSSGLDTAFGVMLGLLTIRRKYNG